MRSMRNVHLRHGEPTQVVVVHKQFLLSSFHIWERFGKPVGVNIFDEDVRIVEEAEREKGAVEKVHVKSGR